MSGRSRAGVVEEGDGAPAADVRDPRLISQEFARALLSRDHAAAARLLSRGACILTADGTEAVGRAEAAGVLAQITASDTELEVLLGRTVACGAHALATQFWCRRSSSSAGGFEDSSKAQLVLAREEDGWAIVIVSPWG